MPRIIFAVCLLASWSAWAQTDTMMLNCAAPYNLHDTGRTTALVERDATSVIVETSLWVGTWHIEQHGELGFRAELATAQVKSGGSDSRKQEVLQYVQSMRINMTGPQGGFVAGRRYPCALTEQTIAHL